jgi:hypothetical protein
VISAGRKDWRTVGSMLVGQEKHRARAAVSESGSGEHAPGGHPGGSRLIAARRCGAPGEDPPPKAWPKGGEFRERIEPERCGPISYLRQQRHWPTSAQITRGSRTGVLYGINPKCMRGNAHGRFGSDCESALAPSRRPLNGEGHDSKQHPLILLCSALPAMVRGRPVLSIPTWATTWTTPVACDSPARRKPGRGAHPGGDTHKDNARPPVCGL